MAFDKKFLEQVVELAVQNAQSGKGGPFAALVVKDGKVVGEGANSVTNLKDPSAHAEVQAIRQACKALNHFELENCEIYASCEPCPMCLGAIYWARAKAVYFAADKKDAALGGFDDAFIYEEINKKYTDRKIKFEKKTEVNGLKPFEEWFKNPNKVLY